MWKLRSNLLFYRLGRPKITWSDKIWWCFTSTTSNLLVWLGSLFTVKYRFKPRISFWEKIWMLKLSSRGKFYKKAVIGDACNEQIFTKSKKIRFARDLKLKIFSFFYKISVITLKNVRRDDYMERDDSEPVWFGTQP